MIKDGMRQAQAMYDGLEEFAPDAERHHVRKLRDDLAELKTQRDDLRADLRTVCQQIHELEEELDGFSA